MRTLFALIPILFLLAPSARAQERACYQLQATDTAGDHPAGDPLAVPGWEQLWEVGLLASTAIQHEALSEPMLHVTLHPGLQAAPVLRAEPSGEPGPMALFAWSRPPETWCSDGPVSLELVLDGARDRLTVASEPGAALVIDGVTRIDGEVLSLEVATPTMRTAAAQVAPRPDGPPEFTLVVTVAADPARPELVVPVHHHYLLLESAEGLASGSAIPPPVTIGRPAEAEEQAPTAVIDGQEQAEAVQEQAEAVQEADEAEPEEDRKSYLGDASSGWFHLGGGGALIRPGNGAFTGGGRFALGIGGYTFFFYGGAGFEMDFSPVVPWKVHGVGYLGVHLPIPVVHPIIGIKVAGGLATDPLNNRAGPSLGIGGQAGFIFRAFDSRGGFRFVVEPTFSLTGMGDDVSTFELWFVAAAVF